MKTNHTRKSYETGAYSNNQSTGDVGCDETFVATQPLSDVGHNAIMVVSSRRPPGFVGICQSLKGCPGYIVGCVALCKWQLMMMELASDFCIGRALTHQYVD
jgi:hypothetical protein